jgi:ssDNA-binding Zn-finger/Zn-ribbon topoisomerase 1
MSDQAAPNPFTGARHDLACAECAELGIQALMKFHPTSRFGPFYGCTRYPECKATHGAHKHNGAPLGKPANKATKEKRIEAHALFDQLWQGEPDEKERKRKRRDSYAWMQQAMGMTKDEAHIGNFDIPTCERLMAAVREEMERRRGVSLQCPKCGNTSGDSWSQCQGSCPMSMSPYFKPPSQP